MRIGHETTVYIKIWGTNIPFYLKKTSQVFCPLEIGGFKYGISSSSENKIGYRFKKSDFNLVGAHEIFWSHKVQSLRKALY